MIRLSIPAALLACLTVTPVVAQHRQPAPKSGEAVVLSATARKNMKVQIEAVGLNCPAVAKVTYVEENVTGRVMRVECFSSDKASQWSIRATVSPGDPLIPKFEPW
ncbi:MAG: hypothetical protein WBF99_12210 [Xanthobacteraceae bacterium]